MADKKEDPIEKRLKCYTQIDHVIRERWLRVLDPTVFKVWYCLKSFCSKDKQTVIPKTTDEDWADYIGIHKQTFVKSVIKLKELNLLEITKLKKTKTNSQPYEYKLNEMPNEVSKEILLQQNIKPLSKNSSFVDQIYNPSKDIFNRKSKIYYNNQTENNTICSDTHKRNFRLCSDTHKRKFRLSIYNIEESLNIEKSFNISKDILIASSKNDAISNFNFKAKRTAPERNNNPQISIKKITPQKKQTISTENRFIIDLWNKIPNTMSHKDLSSKTIETSINFIKYLTDGTFFDKCKINSKFFITDKNIKRNNESIKFPQEWISNNKKFTTREIMRGINVFKERFKNGNWPINKKSLPKQLNNFIYNPFTGSSWLLSCIANNDVKSIAEEKKNSDFNPQYTKYFRDKGLLKIFSEEEMPDVFRGISAIETRVIKDKIFDFDKNILKLKQVIGEPGKLEPMFENYAKFLKEYNRLDKDKIFYQYGYFNEFLEELQNTYSSFKVYI